MSEKSMLTKEGAETPVKLDSAASTFAFGAESALSLLGGGVLLALAAGFLLANGAEIKSLVLNSSLALSDFALGLVSKRLWLSIALTVGIAVATLWAWIVAMNIDRNRYPRLTLVFRIFSVCGLVLYFGCFAALRYVHPSLETIDGPYEKAFFVLSLAPMVLFGMALGVELVLNVRSSIA